jgi:hypothetical protein
MTRVPRACALLAGKFRATGRGTDCRCLRWPFECGTHSRPLEASCPGAHRQINTRNRTCLRRAILFSCSSLRTCWSPSTWRIDTANPQVPRLAMVKTERRNDSAGRPGRTLYRRRSNAPVDGVSNRHCSSLAPLPVLPRGRRCRSSPSLHSVTASRRSKRSLRSQQSLCSKQSQRRRSSPSVSRKRRSNRRKRSRPNRSQMNRYRMDRTRALP